MQRLLTFGVTCVGRTTCQCFGTCVLKRLFKGFGHVDFRGNDGHSFLRLTWPARDKPHFLYATFANLVAVALALVFLRNPLFKFVQNKICAVCVCGQTLDANFATAGLRLAFSDFARPVSDKMNILQKTMDFIMGHGCSLLRTDKTMHVIMVGPWLLSSQNGIDHGRHRGWAVDVEETPQIPMVSVLQAKETA